MRKFWEVCRRGSECEDFRIFRDSRLTASGGPAWHCSTPSSRARSPSCRSTAPADVTEERNRGKNKINAQGQCDVHPLFRPCIPHIEPSSNFSPNPSLSRVVREREGQRQQQRIERRRDRAQGPTSREIGGDESEGSHLLCGKV